MIIALLIIIALVLIFGADAFIELIRGVFTFAFGVFVLLSIIWVLTAWV